MLEKQDLDSGSVEARISEIDEALAAVPDAKKKAWIDVKINQICSDIRALGLMPPGPSFESIYMEFRVTQDRITTIERYELGPAVIVGNYRRLERELDDLKIKKQQLFIMQHLLGRSIGVDSVVANPPSDATAVAGDESQGSLGSTALQIKSEQQQKIKDSRGRKPIDQLVPFAWTGTPSAVASLRSSLLDGGYINRSDKAASLENFRKIFRCEGMPISDNSSLMSIRWLARVQELGLFIRFLYDKGYLGNSRDHFIKAQYIFIKTDGRPFSGNSLQKNAGKVTNEQEKKLKELVDSIK